MKYPLHWLRDYTAIPWNLETLCERLTMAGFEIEAVEETNGGPVLEIEVTPNRADCLSMLGLAREIAAMSGKPLRWPKAVIHKAGGTQHGKVEIADKAGCSRYIGRLLDGVRVKPSPQWMRERLEAAGVRSINNAVDITNFVLLEYGQPQHAFDFALLQGGKLVVRRAVAGERLRSLEGQACLLDEAVLVVADDKQPVALAGVMGGLGSEVHAQTQTVFLETACFSPALVRRCSRRYGISTESSYRFERGVDLSNMRAASERAAALFCELAGAREVWVGDLGRKTAASKPIRIRVDHLNRWLGTGYNAMHVRTRLRALNCRVVPEAGKVLKVTPPAYRRDLQQPADVYEELARIDGYDRLPNALPAISLAPTLVEPPRYLQLYALKQRCAQLGLVEAQSWALLSAEAMEGWGQGGGLRLKNPLSQDQALLRPTLLYGLLQAVRRNASYGQMRTRFFELGAVFAAGKAGLEQQRLGIILAGAWWEDWQLRAESSFFLLKGLVEKLMANHALAIRQAEFAWAEGGESATVFTADQTVLGALGKVSPKVAQRFDLEQPVWFAELDALLLAQQGQHQQRVQPYSLFPPVKRDLSMIVPQARAYAELEQVMRSAGAPLAGQIILKDRYTGKQVQAGCYSITVSIEYRHPQRTLTAEEADRVHQRMVQALQAHCGVHLRA